MFYANTLIITAEMHLKPGKSINVSIIDRMKLFIIKSKVHFYLFNVNLQLNFS